MRSMTSLAHNPALAVPELAPHEPATLLARLRLRDASALGQLARMYGSALTRAAYLHLGDGHAAEDAVQEALLAAWDAAGRTTDATPVWPWLVGIVFNRCRKHLRSLTRRRRREQHASAMRLGLAQSGADNVDRLELIRESLLQLPEPLRCVVIARFEQGLSVSQTALALGLPEGTVKRRCHDAIGRLRVMLGVGPDLIVEPALQLKRVKP